MFCDRLPDTVVHIGSPIRALFYVFWVLRLCLGVLQALPLLGRQDLKSIQRSATRPHKAVIRKLLEPVMVRIRFSIVTAMRAGCWRIFSQAQLLGMG
jgi:hypothetical protein